MKRLMILTALFFLLTSERSIGQRLWILPEAGVGLSYVVKKNITDVDYRSRLTPNVLVSAWLYFSPKISFEGGIGYNQKGYIANNIANDDTLPNVSYLYGARVYYHYINVPVTLNYKVYDKGFNKLWVGAGMNYEFLVNATRYVRVNSYYMDKLFGQEEVVEKPVIGLTQASTGGKHIDLYTLDVALKFQIRYIWADKYSFRLFHEMSLYDITAWKSGTGILHNQYTGVSWGIFIR